MKTQTKKNKYEIDMCNGSILDKLISFSIPLMLSGILQLLFNAVDIIVVGRFTGSEALAAVGSALTDAPAEEIEKIRKDSEDKVALAAKVKGNENTTS